MAKNFTCTSLSQKDATNIYTNLGYATWNMIDIV